MSLPPGRKLTLLLERFAATTRPLAHLDIKNRVRFAFNLSNLVDDTIRSSVDSHVESVVHHCLVVDTAVDCSRVANELSHMLRNREKHPQQVQAQEEEDDDGGGGGDDELRKKKKMQKPTEFLRPNFLRSAKSAELICKAVAEIIKRDAKSAIRIGGEGRVADNAGAASERTGEDYEEEEEEDDTAVTSFLRDAAQQQRQTRVHEIHRCWCALLGVLSLSLRWAAARSPSSMSSLSLVHKWDDEKDGERDRQQQWQERQLLLRAANDVPWRQMHVVGFVVTCTMSMLDAAQESISRDQHGGGGRVVNRNGFSSSSSSSSSSIFVNRTSLFATAEGRRFAVHALNQCDAAISEIHQRQATANNGQEEEDPAATQSQLIAQLPGTLRILTALNSAAAPPSRRRGGQQQQQQQRNSGKRETQDRILSGVNACVQSILTEMHRAFAASASSSSSSSSSSNNSTLLPQRQLVQIFASLGFLHASSFDTLCAVAAPLRVCSLDTRGVAVHQQAALVSFVLNSLQQQQQQHQHGKKKLGAAVDALMKDADAMVCRRIAGVVKVLQEPSGGGRRSARRYEQAVTLLKLLTRCLDVFLPRAGSALCRNLFPVMLETIFGNISSSSSPASVKTAAWLDFRDVLLVMTTLRRQLRMNNGNNGDADNSILSQSLAGIEQNIADTWSTSVTGDTFLFEHSAAEFRLAHQMLPILAAWAAQTGNGPVLKSVLKGILNVGLVPISRLQENRGQEDGENSSNIVVVDRSVKHLVWLRLLKSCVEQVSAQLDACGQDPVDVDDALATLRAWSSRTVRKKALWARLPSKEGGELQLLREWYTAFWLKTYPVLVSPRRGGDDDAALVASAESKSPKQSLEQVPDELLDML